MAQPKPTPFKQRALALKLQVADGTPVVPSTALDGIRLYDGSSGIEFDEVTDSPDSSFFTGDEVAIANERAFIEGEFRLIPPAQPGDATLGILPNERLLLIGGMTRVLSPLTRQTLMNPITDDIPAATAYWWHSGTHKQVFDARSQISSLSVEIGKRISGKARVQGSFADVLEEAIPAVVVNESLGPVVSAANSIGTIQVLPGGTPVEIRAKSFSIDFNTDLNSDEYTGQRYNDVTDRKATWKMQIARTALADFDPFLLRRAGTKVRVAVRVKNSDGRYVEQFARGQIKDIGEVEINGKYGWDLGGPCNASSAGGDEFGIIAGDETLHLNGTLPAGTQGVPYSAALTPSGAWVGPLAYTLDSGALPAGTSLNAATGAVTGTPTTIETAVFTIRVTDATPGTPLTAVSDSQSVAIA